MLRRDHAGSISYLYVDAWNAHDVKAVSALFHAEAVFVNRFGVMWDGADKIAAGHRLEHETIYKDAKLSFDVPHARHIADDATAMHIRADLELGPAHPAASREVEMRFVFVVTRVDRLWGINTAVQVTVPEPRDGA